MMDVLQDDSYSCTEFMATVEMVLRRESGSQGTVVR